MKKISFLSAAEDEMIQSALFYETQTNGLGTDFLTAVDFAIQSIHDNPELWPVIRNQVRRRLLKRFPFGILYRISQHEITVIAVMNLHRDPDYWFSRMMIKEKQGNYKQS
jgi:hypothetical protein